MDAQRSCDMLGVELIEGEYDYLNWINAVKGFENEPEKGKRCEVCFDNRLEVTAKKAKHMGEKKITTTLLMSPKKSHKQLRDSGEILKKSFDVEFIAPDFRIGGGTGKQFALAKKDKLYHQNYCGCAYALKAQRNQQKRFADELICPLSEKEIYPGSIEERVGLYQKRMKLEEENKKYKITKEKFLNYRLLRAYVKEDKKIVPSYFVRYSTIKKTSTRGKIECEIDGVFYHGKDQIKFITLQKVNNILKTSYKNVRQMMRSSLELKQQKLLREKIEDTFFSISPLIILDEVDVKKRYEIYLESREYDDVRENLVIF